MTARHLRRQRSFHILGHLPERRQMHSSTGPGVGTGRCIGPKADLSSLDASLKTCDPPSEPIGSFFPSSPILSIGLPACGK